MDNLQLEQEDTEKQEENTFKGTFVSVMLLGGFIILSWLGVWMLYLLR